jgi:hypothetical protein
MQSPLEALNASEHVRKNSAAFCARAFGHLAAARLRRPKNGAGAGNVHYRHLARRASLFAHFP